VPKKPVPDTTVAPEDSLETGEYASPPCYQHEIDAVYQGVSAGDRDSVREWRKAQRRRLAFIRDGIDPGQRSAISAAVMDHLRKGFPLANSSIGFYWPLGAEIDLRPLMTELAGKGVQLALPAIVGRYEPLEFRRWRPGDALDSSGHWNIPTPFARKLLVPDLLCVPLLGFDESCHRLGYGGGFYDRTLAVPGFTPTTIGIAYEFGRLATIHPQEHDVPMHAIVTEQAVVHRKT
jgi:5-formyltetrahydrofolate cyclo-ligase